MTMMPISAVSSILDDVQEVIQTNDNITSIENASTSPTETDSEVANEGATASTAPTTDILSQLTAKHQRPTQMNTRTMQP